jgi:hypothetical protein
MALAAALMIAVPKGATGQPSEIPVTMAEAQYWISDASRARRYLFAKVHAKKPASPDFVSITMLDGFRSSQSTLYLTPSNGRVFRAEMIV